MTLTKPLLTATIVGLLLTGCETTNTGMGAGIGAATGAVLGKATGDHDDKRIFIGAAIGALAGAAVGDYMDKTILKPNNLNYPINRIQFVNSLK